MRQPRVLPKTSPHYVGLVSMYQANLGLTLQEAEERANKIFPRQYPPQEAEEPHECGSDDCCPPF